MVKLYSTGCPKCAVLEKKLNLKQIEYSKVTSEEEIRTTGFISVPLLEVGGKIMEFAEAVKWVNEYKG